MVPAGVLLHAGPQFPTPEVLPRPVLHAAALACLYEGWAQTWAEAIEDVQAGRIALSAGHEYGVAVPLAGVVSPSMFLVEVDAQLPNSQRRFSPLHEGLAHANCLGVRDDDYAQHRRWLDTRFAQWASMALRSPLALGPVLSGALREGDDAHSRCMAGSRLLAKALERNQPCESGDIAAFVRNSPLLSLPVWMAMASSVLSHLDGEPGSGAITAVGANGVEIGVRVAGLHGWRTCAAPGLVPAGPLGPGRPLPAIGDSGVVDVLGLGGQLPAVRSVLDPAGCLQAPPGIELATPAVQLLGGRSAVVDLSVPSRAPVRLLMGVIDAAGEGGRLGPGVATLPNQLLTAIRAELGN